MADRVGVRPISNDEGARLLRIVRRSSGSVVTWRRAQMVLLSAQGMAVAKIAEVIFTSPDRVRDVLHNFNADGFNCLYPRYRGGRPPTFTLGQRQQIKRLALSRPQDHDLPLSTWSLAKLAEFLVAEGVVDDISHEGLRALLAQEGVSFQRLKTFKQSNDPDYAAKKNRVVELDALADGHTQPGLGDPSVVICMDEFGPLNLQPHPGRHWALAGGGGVGPGAASARPTSGPMGCGTCWPAMTWLPTDSMGMSRRARAGVSSLPSAGIGARCTRPRSAWRWCWTTSAPPDHQDRSPGRGLG
jgi:transposase